MRRQIRLCEVGYVLSCNEMKGGEDESKEEGREEEKNGQGKKTPWRSSSFSSSFFLLLRVKSLCSDFLFT